jgi:DNA polymerase/3'-5' exonuclease PolX
MNIFESYQENAKLKTQEGAFSRKDSPRNDDILEIMSDVSDVSERSLSPILSNNLRCKFCTCDEDESACICIKCRNTQHRATSPDEEMTQIDSDVVTHISFKRQKLDFELPVISGYSLYQAIQDEEKRGTNFIFDVDEMLDQWNKDKIKIGIIKSKNISNLRANIFDQNIFKLTGKHIEHMYNSSLTHVVIDKEHGYQEVDELLFKWCGLTEPFPFHVVNEDWLIDFSHMKIIPDEKRYARVRPEKKQVVVQEDIFSEDDDYDDDDDGENNHYIIDIFKELADIYEQKLINELNDVFKSRAYKTACNKLEKLPHIEYVEDIPTHIWPKESNMWQHIKEIVETGTCEKLVYFRNHPDIITNRTFTKIHGIGPSRARDLMNAGHRSIADLRSEKGLNSLRPLERTCLSCYEDLQQRIPRNEVQEFVEIVEKVVKNEVPESEVIAAGSFRRGLPTCGDIDILIMIPDNYDGIHLISFLHEKLGAKGANLFVYDLTNVSENSTNYMCIGKLPKSGSLYRRIDVKVYNAPQYPFALSAFTGCDHWNRSLRYFARKKGFSLSDKGLTVKSQHAIDYLFSVGRFEQAMQSSVGNCVPFISDERDIFITLGLSDYFKEPCERTGSIFQ